MSSTSPYLLPRPIYQITLLSLIGLSVVFAISTAFSVLLRLDQDPGILLLLSSSLIAYILSLAQTSYTRKLYRFRSRLKNAIDDPTTDEFKEILATESSRFTRKYLGQLTLFVGLIIGYSAVVTLTKPVINPFLEIIGLAIIGYFVYKSLNDLQLIVGNEKYDVFKRDFNSAMQIEQSHDRIEYSSFDG